MKRVLIICIFIIAIINPSYAQDQGENYCHDKESWKEWDELVQKYPHDMDIQMLHAVRIGFCKKIEDGTITFKTARDVFNHLHESIYKKAKIEQNQWLKNRQL